MSGATSIAVVRGVKTSMTVLFDKLDENYLELILVNSYGIGIKLKYL